MTPELRAALVQAMRDMHTTLSPTLCADAIAPIIDTAIMKAAIKYSVVQGPGYARDALLAAADDLDEQREGRRAYADDYGQGMFDAFDIAAQRVRARANEGVTE